MTDPENVFKTHSKQHKSGNLSFLTAQVSHWQKLTKSIQPLLPQPEKWQVVCYQSGVLTITGENQAMVSQLRYLQSQYTANLMQLDGLHDLQKLQVRLRNPHKMSEPTQNQIAQTMTSETQEMLQSAASLVNDVKLSQALLRLASNKK